MANGTPSPNISRIAFVGNYLPRRCGIATFTTDLCESVAAGNDGITCIAVPVNDSEDGYDYPTRVRFEIEEKDIESYRRAAGFLNINAVDLVCLQHEYGIFGGKCGSHILTLLRELRMPVVTTLHTVLSAPDADQLQILQEVAKLSDRLVVMSQQGKEMLTDVYGISPEIIDLIPHGIPDVPFVDPSFHKDLFGVEGKLVLLSFGLLSASKGLEHVISALPEIVSVFPNVVYIILGETHPHVLTTDGESYRLSLQWLAREKGVESNVIFYNRFVSQEELNEFIGAADIYLTPYLNEAQITSGTLAYTIGAGKAVVSTPYWYAKELLSDNRGVLVPFHDPSAIAAAVVALLGDDANRHAMRKRAYMFGREMIWTQVALRYRESFARARNERRYFTKPGLSVMSLDRHPGELPPIKLSHLRNMTDETGILQHAIFTIPNYHEGYTTDDNARGLIVSTLLEQFGNQEAFDLASRYLAFLWYAYNPESGRFRNFMNYQRNWLEASGSEDSHGRSLWALGTVLGRSNSPALKSMASWLFEKALPAILDTTSPRAWAFSLIGLQEYLRRFSGDRLANQVQEELSQRLLSLYGKYRTADWRWYENSLTYCNAVLPHASLICGRSVQSAQMVEAGLESLAWLCEKQRALDGGHFVPIGSNGFYTKNGVRARFDQQPVEGQATISACLEAYRVTKDIRWRKEAQLVFEWFLGRNDLNLSIYDPTTGGCRDGLHPDRLNENLGAESTLAFLHSLLELRATENTLTRLDTRLS